MAKFFRDTNTGEQFQLQAGNALTPVTNIPAGTAVTQGDIQSQIQKGIFTLASGQTSGATPLAQAAQITGQQVTPATAAPIQTTAPTGGQQGGFQEGNDIQQLLQALQPQQTEQQKKFIEDQTASLNRLIDLEEQLAKANVPSPELAELQKQIAQQQQALRELTPEKFLESEPGLKGVGISQSFLERRVAQERDPIANALQNLLFSESILSEEEDRRRQGLQAQSRAQQNILGLREELQGLQPEPFELPTAIQNRILEEQLFPEQPDPGPGELTTEIVGGFEILRDQNGDIVSRRPLRAGEAGGGTPSPAVSESQSEQVASWANRVYSGIDNTSSVPSDIRSEVIVQVEALALGDMQDDLTVGIAQGVWESKEQAVNALVEAYPELDRQDIELEVENAFIVESAKEPGPSFDSLGSNIQTTTPQTTSQSFFQRIFSFF